MVAFAAIALCTGQCLLADFIKRKIKEKKGKASPIEHKAENLETIKEDVENN